MSGVTSGMTARSSWAATSWSPRNATWWEMVRRCRAQFTAVGGVEPLAPSGGRVDELLQVADDAMVFVEDLV